MKKVVGYTILALIFAFVIIGTTYAIYVEGWRYVLGLILCIAVSMLMVFGIYLIKK